MKAVKGNCEMEVCINEDNTEISDVFVNKIIDEKAISLDNNYIIKMSGTSSGKLGILTSDNAFEVYVYDNTSLRKIHKFSKTDSTVCDIKFCPLNDNLIYTGSADGSIKLWDTRIDKNVTTFEEDSSTRKYIKPIISFDVSCDGRILCGGSELTQGDAFMLFWDVRKKSLLGGYWNSHTDDIVQIHFNKEKSNKIVTGSVDGLINVFDINEQKEDDALQYSLSIDCAVDKINWISEDKISCLTQNIDLQLWNTETADQLNLFTREEITKNMKGTIVDDCYAIDVYTNELKKPFLLTSSYADEGCLKMLDITENKLSLHSSFKGNRQIIRCSWYDSKNDLLLSGGENGILSLWNCGSPSNNKITPKQEKSKTLHTSSMKKAIKNKPY